MQEHLNSLQQVAPRIPLKRYCTCVGAVVGGCERVHGWVWVGEVGCDVGGGG